MADDLLEEARALGRGDLWLARQLIRAGARLHLVSGGIAMVTDVRHACRSLLATRWFTLGAIVTCALGIGVNLAVFAVVDRMMFRPLPYAEPDRLILLRSCSPTTRTCESGSFPGPVAAHLQRGSSTLSSIAVAGMTREYTLVGAGDHASAFLLTGVSAGVLPTLGVRPLLGRDIHAEEATARERVVWLSYEAWQARLGADPSVLGRTLRAATNTATIIGVLPPGFIPPGWASHDPGWQGLVVDYAAWSSIVDKGGLMAPVARLRPGASLKAVQAEIDALVTTLVGSGALPSARPPLVLAHALQTNLFSRYRDYLQLIVVTAGFLLLLMCANLTVLFIARGRARRHFLAICGALGASRARLIGGVVLEAALVGMAGTVAAVGVLAVVGGVLRAWLPPIFARYAVSVIDVRFLAASTLAAVAASLIVALVPAWQAAQADVRTVLQQTDTRTGSSRTGTWLLLATQAGLGALVVLAATLAARSFFTMAFEDRGFDPANLHTVSVSSKPPRPLPEQWALVDEAARRARLLPGVIAAGASDYAPGTGDAPMRGYQLADSAARGAEVTVTDGYLEALDVRRVAGRLITADDVTGRSPVVVLSRSALLQAFPGAVPENAIGRSWTPLKAPPRLVVGVIEDPRFSYGRADPAPAAFVVPDERPTRGRIVVRVADGVFDATALQRALVAEEGSLTVVTTPVAPWMDADLDQPRFLAMLLLGFSLTTLLIAVVGLFALATFDVAQRRRELGIRLALGARPRSLATRVLRSVLWPTMVGTAAGLLLAVWISRLGESLLYQTSGRDPVAYVVVLTTFAVASGFAAWIPARRAATTDPVEVLRSP